MFSSGVEGIGMPKQECKLGSVLHSQLEVVKEEPSTGQNSSQVCQCFRTAMNRSCQWFRAHVTSLNLSWTLYMWADKCPVSMSIQCIHAMQCAWKPAKLENPWVCWAAQGSESSVANPNRCQQPDKSKDVNGFMFNYHVSNYKTTSHSSLCKMQVAQTTWISTNSCHKGLESCCNEQTPQLHRPWHSWRRLHAATLSLRKIRCLSPEHRKVESLFRIHF